jgi:hypothetical protein
MLLIDDKKEVKFQLDSGATANLISKSYLSESTEIENSDHTLTMYNHGFRTEERCVFIINNDKFDVVTFVFLDSSVATCIFHMTSL